MDAEGWFRTLAVASLADGVLDQRETALLLRCSTWLGLAPARARAIVEETRRDPTPRTGAIPQQPADRRRLLSSVLDIVLADGRLTDEEARCVHALAGTLHVPADEVATLIAAAQGRFRYMGAHPARPSDPATLPAGTLVGDQFRIVKLLGAGGFAAVYRAHHVLLDEEVALKVLLPATIASSKTAERRFYLEARMCRSFRHRYVPGVREVGRDSLHGPYFAMDLVRGRTLASHIAEGALAPERALRLALQALGALEEAHRADIVHRDVKPENLMVTEGPTGKEEVRLLDFGVAKSMAPGDEEVKLTTDGVLIGSVTYMSPEQAQGLRLDGRSDLYSLAVVLYEALTGCLPYELSPDTEDFCRAAIVKIVSEAPRDPLALAPGLPPRIVEALMPALAKDPALRPQTAKLFGETLAAALRDEGGPSRLKSWTRIFRGASGARPSSSPPTEP